MMCEDSSYETNTTINRSSGANNGEFYTQPADIRKEIGGIDADPVMPWSKGSQMLCRALNRKMEIR